VNELSVLQVKTTPTIKDRLMAARTPSQLPVKSVRVAVSLQKLKENFNTGIRQSQTQRYIHVHAIDLHNFVIKKLLGKNLRPAT